MRILLLASRLPYPLDNGEDLRVFHFAKNLSKKHDLHFLGYGEQSVPDEVSGFFKQIHLVEEENLNGNGNRKSLMRSFSPRQIYSFDPRIESCLQSIFRDGKFDALWIPAWRMIPYLSTAGDTPVVVDVMDDGVLELAREIKNCRWSMDLVLKSKKLFVTYLFERKYLSQAAVCIFVADRDAEVFNRVCRRTRISVIPNGVDVAYYRPSGIPEEYPSLVFEGNMGFPPSVDAAVYFCQTIFPLVQRAVPKTKLYLVGKDPAPVIVALQGPNVVVTGYVDDVRPYLSRASVFVCPMRKGAGIKNKILQAWAMGKPVVATPIALGGLKGEVGESVLVASNPKEFAKLVIMLLSDKQQRQSIGKKALDTVRKYHDWAKSTRTLESVLETL